MDIDWDRVRVFDKEVAQMFVNMIKSSDSARSVSSLNNANMFEYTCISSRFSFCNSCKIWINDTVDKRLPVSLVFKI